MADAGTYAAVLGTLLVAHYVGDFWVQTDYQAQHKADKTAEGWGCLVMHVLTYTLTSLGLLIVVVLATGLRVGFWQVLLGLSVSAVTHGWADRRRTLRWLCRLLGKEGFYDAGQPPVGTGAHALDQSFHVFWVLVAALVIAS